MAKIENHCASQLQYLGGERMRRQNQIDAAYRNRLGFLWVWLLEVQLAKIERRYHAVERMIAYEHAKNQSGPRSGVHG